jgi:N-acetyl-gamma-glutamyl-phosphate reductase
MRGNFTRGILAGVYTKSDLSQSEARKLYRDYYESHPFVIISESPVDLKRVINTNKCLLHIIKENDNLFITSAIDNLVKGAAGQAVQNMNLIFGLNEETGLRIKPIAF